MIHSYVMLLATNRLEQDEGNQTTLQRLCIAALAFLGLQRFALPKSWPARV